MSKTCATQRVIGIMWPKRTILAQGEPTKIGGEMSIYWLRLIAKIVDDSLGAAVAHHFAKLLERGRAYGTHTLKASQQQHQALLANAWDML